MLKSIEEIYYIIDEVVKNILKNETKKGRKSKLTMSEARKSKLTMSEAITLLIEGHRQNLITDKQLYRLMTSELRNCFRKIPSYAQFTRMIRKALPYLDLIIKIITRINARSKQDIYIVDSTSLPVNGYNRKNVKWAGGTAGKGKNMHGFYQGFKLHIIINQNREVVSAATTTANVHDVELLKYDFFIKHIKGILVGDKGYIASLHHRMCLRKKGIQLIAKQRNNMDPYLQTTFK